MSDVIVTPKQGSSYQGLITADVEVETVLGSQRAGSVEKNSTPKLVI